MISQILRQWFWDCYDHLVALFITNIVLFAIASATLIAVVFAISPILSDVSALALVHLLAIAFVAILAPLLALWFACFGYFGEQVRLEKYPGIREIGAGVRRDFLLLLGYFAMCCAIAAVLAINIWFYSMSGMIHWLPSFTGYFLSGICLWMIALLVASMGIGIPLRVRDRVSILTTMKRSLLIMVRRPGPVIGIFIFILSLWVISGWLRFAPIFLFGFSATAMLINSMRDVMEDLVEKSAASPVTSTAASWKTLREDEDDADRRRMARARYERTFRDLLRPWEN